MLPSRALRVPFRTAAAAVLAAALACAGPLATARAQSTAPPDTSAPGTRAVHEDAVAPMGTPDAGMPETGTIDDDGSSRWSRGAVQTLQPSPEAAPRPVPEASLARYRADPDFRYDTAHGDTGPSVMSRLWDWFTRTYLEPVFRSATSRPGTAAISVLAFVLLIGLVVWLARGGDIGIFRRRDEGTGMPHGDLADAARLTADDLDERLARARADGQWREATRWRFLLGLGRMGAAGVVALDAHKTDGDYAREVRRAGPQALATAFAAAATAFAWVWYGRAALDADALVRLDATFDTLDRALDAARPGARPVPPSTGVSVHDSIRSGDAAPRGGSR